MNWKQRLDRWLRISVRRKLLDEHLEQMRAEMTGRVLEIGAGRNGRRGEFHPPLENTDNWIYLNLLSIQSPHVQADVQRLPFRSDSFDTVVCLEVMEYIDEPSVGLREAKRVIRSGGKLVISLPFMHRHDAPTDFWRFTEAGIERILSENSLQIIALKKQGSGLAVAVSILKHWIHVSGEDRRLWYALVAKPFLDYLWNRDKITAATIPTLETFSTGYLILAAPSVNRPSQVTEGKEID